MWKAKVIIIAIFIVILGVNIAYAEPTPAPEPTQEPVDTTVEPTIEPTATPTIAPTVEPTIEPTVGPLPTHERVTPVPIATKAPTNTPPKIEILVGNPETITEAPYKVHIKVTDDNGLALVTVNRRNTGCSNGVPEHTVEWTVLENGTIPIMAVDVDGNRATYDLKITNIGKLKTPDPNIPIIPNPKTLPPTVAPTKTPAPTKMPTKTPVPTVAPTPTPTVAPTVAVTVVPTKTPTAPPKPRKTPNPTEYNDPIRNMVAKLTGSKNAAEASPFILLCIAVPLLIYSFVMYIKYMVHIGTLKRYREILEDKKRKEDLKKLEERK